MKKTVTRPDGTQEVVEGTAEEIAEYEKKLREAPKGKGKKPILHGAEVDGVPLSDDEVNVVRLKRAGLLPQKEYVFYPQWQPVQTWLKWCSVCGVFGCTTNHITYGQTIVGDSVPLWTDGALSTTLTTDGIASSLLEGVKITS